ncbi:DUF4179 domain-containing protein [Paenibacillus tuaregi]|uniref:DUF4179 domain-containing protein n=1 Tax=Paenibacillus tuaregi TaxID=1816681 RepID=UPI00083850D6|nr:DUF4179 domain-containing protein [Paenibacillus tuaregi]
MSLFEMERELRESAKAQLKTPVPDIIRKRQDQVYASLAELAQPAGHRTRKPVRRPGRVAAAITAAAMIAILGSGFVSPAMAQAFKQLPVVGGIFKLADELGLRTAGDQGLVAASNAFDTHEGVTLNIREVVFDGTLLSFPVEREGGNFQTGITGSKDSSSDNSQESRNKAGAIQDVDLLVNGVSTADYPGGYRPEIQWGPSSNPDAALFQVLNNSDLSNANSAHLPDEFDLTVKIALKGIKEPYVISLPVRKNSDRVIVQSGDTKHLNGLDVTLEQIEFSPISTILRMKIHADHELTAAEKNSLFFEVEGNYGEKAHLIGGKGIYPDRKTETVELVLDRFKEAPESITIRPFKPVFEDPSASSGQFAIDKNGEILKQYIDGLKITVQVDRSRIEKLYNL